jgi:hypothetical protein
MDAGDIQDVLLFARVTGVTAIIIWFIGAPLISLAAVPFPSDTEFIYMGAVAALLGLTLVPVVLTIGGPMSTRTKALVRFTGLAECLALIASGVVLVLAAGGGLGERAPAWVPDSAVVVIAALFVWIGIASIALRGPSTIERSIFWLGLLTGASAVVPAVGSILMFYFVKDFVVTDASVFPFLLVDLLIWVSLPAWLTAVVVSL